jgi:hypothetical protein
MLFEIAEGIIRADVREVRWPGLTMPAQRPGETGGDWPLSESNACKEAISSGLLIVEYLSQHHITDRSSAYIFCVFEN